MNVERLKLAMEIIAKIPDEKFDLAMWQRNSSMDPGEEHKGPVALNMQAAENMCGTLACAAGWLAMSPEFQAFGLYVGKLGQPMLADPTDDIPFNGHGSLAQLLNTDYHTASNLFSYRTLREEIDFHYRLMTDKQLWLTRARNLLRDYKDND